MIRTQIEINLGKNTPYFRVQSEEERQKTIAKVTRDIDARMKENAKKE